MNLYLEMEDYKAIRKLAYSVIYDCIKDLGKGIPKRQPNERIYDHRHRSSLWSTSIQKELNWIHSPTSSCWLWCAIADIDISKLREKFPYRRT